MQVHTIDTILGEPLRINAPRELLTERVAIDSARHLTAPLVVPTVVSDRRSPFHLIDQANP